MRGGELASSCRQALKMRYALRFAVLQLRRLITDVVASGEALAVAPADEAIEFVRE